MIKINYIKFGWFFPEHVYYLLLIGLYWLLGIVCQLLTQRSFKDLRERVRSEIGRYSSPYICCFVLFFEDWSDFGQFSIFRKPPLSMRRKCETTDDKPTTRLQLQGRHIFVPMQNIPYFVNGFLIHNLRM